MSDIHNILSKHFDGESTPEEELLVQQFKHEHPEEYHRLQAFWAKRNIQLIDFDTSQAWQQVEGKAQQPKRKRMYVYLRRTASVAAVFLLMALGYYVFTPPANNQIWHELSTQQLKDTIELADGSVVYLNQQASFSYPQTFEPDKREVRLEGEAFFEVAKDAQRPFIINTTHADIRVLGTSFNINTDADQTEVSVTTGKVSVQASTK